jgi:hypothetical protein
MERMTKRDRVLEAIKAIGRPCSIKTMQEWLEHRYAGPPYADVPNYLSALTVNDRSRRHNDRGRKNFTPDPHHPRDLLIKARVRGTKFVRYWFYDHATDAPTAHVSNEDLDWSYNRRKG